MQPQYPFPGQRGGYPSAPGVAYPPFGIRGQAAPQPFGVQAPTPAFNPRVHPGVYPGANPGQITPQQPFGPMLPHLQPRGGLSNPPPPIFGRGQLPPRGGFTATQVAYINAQMTQSISRPYPGAAVAPPPPSVQPVQREIPTPFYPPHQP